jgi:hypothetical protein
MSTEIMRVDLEFRYNQVEKIIGAKRCPFYRNRPDMVATGTDDP